MKITNLSELQDYCDSRAKEYPNAKYITVDQWNPNAKICIGFWCTEPKFRKEDYNHWCDTESSIWLDFVNLDIQNVDFAEACFER